MNTDINGFTMHYEVFGDAGSPLLWLSGWTGTGADWKFVFSDVPAGFQIIGPDLRGNGASSGFDGTHRFEQSAWDVFALLDQLGVKRVSAIGLSGGGIALLHMAIQQPQRIEAMVLVSAPPYFPQQARAIQRAFALEALPEREQTLMRQRSQGGDKQIAWLIEQTRNMAESTDDVNFTPQMLHTVQARTLIEIWAMLFVLFARVRSLPLWRSSPSPLALVQIRPSSVGCARWSSTLYPEPHSPSASSLLRTPHRMASRSPRPISTSRITETIYGRSIS